MDYLGIDEEHFWRVLDAYRSPHLSWTEAPEGTRRQDCKPPAYMSNGAVYLTRRDVIMEQKSIWGTVTRPYVMPAERSVNVDSELDLKLIEVLMKEKTQKSQRNED